MITLHVNGNEPTQIELEKVKTNILAVGAPGMDFVLLVTSDGEYGEIIVSESGRAIVNAIESGVINLDNNTLHVQTYDSYEGAYSVALSMREPNPLCYDNYNGDFDCEDDSFDY